jgi:hypothetical protein
MASDSATSFFLCKDADCVEGLSLFVRDLQLPFLARLEFAINVPEQLTGYDRGLMPSRLVVRQLLALDIDALVLVANVEKVSRHRWGWSYFGGWSSPFNQPVA